MNTCSIACTRRYKLQSYRTSRKVKKKLKCLGNFDYKYSTQLNGEAVVLQDN